MSDQVSRRWVLYSAPVLAVAAGVAPVAAQVRGQTWATRAYIHYDRTAAPWLIKRFIDPDAVFVFVGWGQEEAAPKDAIRFALPGGDLSTHDDAGTTFEKLIRRYKVTDPAVAAMSRTIAAGVNWALKGMRPKAGDKYEEMAYGLLPLADGTMIVTQTDEENLALWMRNYDAIYAKIRTDLLMEERGLTLPPPNGRGNEPKTLFLRDLLKSAPKTPVGG